MTITQADVDEIIKRARESNYGLGLSHKQNHLQISTYEDLDALALLLINGWDGKYDLISAVAAALKVVEEKTRKQFDPDELNRGELS
jgi:hypothetical protein